MILYRERKCASNIFKSFKVAKIFNHDLDEAYKDYAKDILLKELSQAIFEEIEKGDIAVHLMPIIESEVSYGYDSQDTELRGEICFRPFKFCKDCSCLSQDSFNGGYCTRMNDMVHITDGCTSSPDLKEEGIPIRPLEKWEENVY